jgi:hypothetical protein
MSVPVLYDACVLYGNEVRDLLVRIAISGMVRAHWTDEILDEAFGNLAANRPDLSPERLTVTRERMNLALPGALEPFGVEAKTPDDFVLDQISLDEGTVRDCVHQIARGRTRPPKTYEAVLNALERAGLVGSAAALRD